MKRRALIVFAKEPQAGKVKTRLCPPFTYEEAGALYRAFLKDAFEQYSRLSLPIGMDVVAFVTPNRFFFNEFLSELNVKDILVQSGSDLGDRMFTAFKNVFDQGYHHAVVIGTDHPTLPDAIIQQAFEQLDSHDGVIGPASDGGYYLLGIKQARSEYFSEIAWSTDTVFKTTRSRFDRLNETYFELPEWYDVDDIASLESMISDMADRRGAVPVHTHAFLQEIRMIPKFSERV
ncbi:TIGR04282 family arsenosugar biosynthesis glycosyltransferase [bacterium]|nr:TIGR04282 family arsenosugar biosynthesis glycosyltransferase [bacterium]